MEKKKVLALFANVMLCALAVVLVVYSNYIVAAIPLITAGIIDLIFFIPSRRDIDRLEAVGRRDNINPQDLKDFRRDNPGSSIIDSIVNAKK